MVGVAQRFCVHCTCIEYCIFSMVYGNYSSCWIEFYFRFAITNVKSRREKKRLSNQLFLFSTFFFFVASLPFSTEGISAHRSQLFCAFSAIQWKVLVWAMRCKENEFENE